MTFELQRLNRNSLTPLYLQVADQLRREIAGGNHGPGDAVPSENELVERLAISRGTAVRALAELEREELILRERGRGTFVASGGRAKLLTIALAIIGFKETYYRRAGTFSDLVFGVAAASVRSASLSVLHFPSQAEFFNRLDDLKCDHALDGLLLRPQGDVTRDELGELNRVGIPYVLLRRKPQRDQAACVTSDDRTGGYLATNHLTDQGHRRIAIIVGDLGHSIWRERIDGYSAALERAGIAVSPEYVEVAPSWLEDDGQKATCRLLELPDRPTAIFAAGDYIAVGAYHAAAALGLSVPRDVSVVGYDDVEVASRLTPPLTTVRVSYYEMGQKGASLLFDLIRRRVSESEAPIHVLQPKLVIRESTAVRVDAGPNADAWKGGRKVTSQQVSR